MRKHAITNANAMLYLQNHLPPSQEPGVASTDCMHLKYRVLQPTENTMSLEIQVAFYNSNAPMTEAIMTTTAEAPSVRPEAAF